MRTVLTVIGIALGVAVFVSLQIAIHTAIESFNSTVDHVTGKANLQVTSMDGVSRRDLSEGQKGAGD